LVKQALKILREHEADKGWSEGILMAKQEVI